MRISIKQQGGAAVIETILLVPFILLLIGLSFTSAEFWIAKGKNSIEARTNAWRSSLFILPCLNLPIGSQGNVVDDILGQVPDLLRGVAQDVVNGIIDGALINSPLSELGQACNEDNQRSNDFYNVLTRSAEYRNYQRDFVGEIKAGPGDAHPQAKTGSSVRIYRPAWITGGWFENLRPYAMEDEHTLDAKGVWPREYFKDGYDRFLDRKLDSDYVFPNYFPHF